MAGRELRESSVWRPVPRQLTLGASAEQISSETRDSRSADGHPMDAKRPGPPENGDAPPPLLTARAPFFANPELIPLVLEAGKIGVWSWDVGSTQVAWSSNVEEILGLPQDSFPATTAIFESDVHPDDRPAVLAAMQEVAQTLKPSRVMYRLQPRHGGDQR